MPSADCTKALHYKKKILGKVEPTEEGKEGEDEKRGRGRKWQENKGEGREKGRGGGRKEKKEKEERKIRINHLLLRLWHTLKINNNVLCQVIDLTEY